MNNVDTILEGHRARTRLERMFRNDVPIDRDQLLGLVAKMGAAIDEALPPATDAAGLPAGVSRGFAVIVHDGGRR